MNIMMIPWAIGWIATLHPIYTALMRSDARTAARRRNQGYTTEIELTHGMVVGNIAGATIFSLFWFVIVPFYASHILYRRHKPDLEKEIEIFTEEQAHAEELKDRMAKARKEIEVTYTESEW